MISVPGRCHLASVAKGRGMGVEGRNIFPSDDVSEYHFSGALQN